MRGKPTFEILFLIVSAIMLASLRVIPFYAQPDTRLVGHGANVLDST